MDSGATREKRRSERVKLSVPVLVAGETLSGEPIQEVTQTVIVNAHGGLFRLKAELLVGQPIMINNMQTNREESSRVVRSELLPGGEFGIAFEFDNPAPEFWGVSLPPADWNVLKADS